jgi:hypothetical protein
MGSGDRIGLDADCIKGVLPLKGPYSEDWLASIYGTADTEADVFCPWCTEKTGITLDPGSGPDQEYEEDCPVCCRPWRVSVRYDVDGAALVRLNREDG